MTSIFLDSLRCLLLQQVVSGSGVALDPLTALIHVAPSAVAVLFLPSMVLEWPALRTSTCIATSWGYLAISCAIAFSLNLVVCALIGATSALTTSVSGILKDFVCIALAVTLHGVRIGPLQWTGYAIAICALAVHHYRRCRGAACISGKHPSHSANKEGLQYASLKQSNRSHDSGRIVLKGGDGDV